MKTKLYIAAIVPLLLLSLTAAGQDIVIENRLMRLVVGENGEAVSLVSKSTGEECLDTSATVPLCTITQYRPYDNENFLMFPAKPKVFRSNHVERTDEGLRVEFEDTYDIAIIGLDIHDSYIGFHLDRVDYRIEDIGIKRKTEIDEFALLQLPVKKRGHFGEWLNVTWDGKAAVCLMGTHPATRIDSFQDNGRMTMYAGLDSNLKMYGAGAALVVSPKDGLLDCIRDVEEDYGMPEGVESRRRPEYRYSYYELRDVTVDNIDEHISYAKKGGFKAMVVYYMDFAKACGHYEWKDAYPHGIEDVKEITRKIKAAGMIPGFHIHYSKVHIDDPYVSGGFPDPRINCVRRLTLAEPVDERATEIFVEENPEGLRMEDGRRLLRVDDELIAYKSISTEPPYRLSGCERGVYNSSPASHSKWHEAKLLDVDDWPVFLRIDQSTGIQKEIAERLGRIYKDAGFEFMYFDGAEDVPMPYWYNVSKSQLTVYDELDPAPLFSEGALKSHYGWHILTRGNAFDLFRPEQLRQAMKKYTLRCAAQIADDFTSVNFGWLDYLAPGDKTIGMQPDMYEYACSKALAWDCPISLVGKLDELRAHPRTEDNLRVTRLWEEAELTGAITAEQKELLKNPDAEFYLNKDKNGKFHLFPCRQIVDNKALARAFMFEDEGRCCILYWHRSGKGEMRMRLGKGAEIHDDRTGKRIPIRRDGDLSRIPVEGRMIIRTGLSPEESVAAFREALGTMKQILD